MNYPASSGIAGPLRRAATKRRVTRGVLWGLAALYVATWIWGVPAVHTDFVREVLGLYKSLVARDSWEIRPSHPTLDFGPTCALAPGVVLMGYGYLAGGLTGGGGWRIYLWGGGSPICVLDWAWVRV